MASIIDKHHSNGWKIPDDPIWTPSAWERWKRIKISLAAYAYEFESESILTDAQFDSLALAINPSISTVEDYYRTVEKQRARRLDKFFRTIFHPDTGMWIHSHPELDRIAGRYHHTKERLNDSQ